MDRGKPSNSQPTNKVCTKIQRKAENALVGKEAISITRACYAAKGTEDAALECNA